MAGVYIPESLPTDSQYAYEATQLSQPQFSQTQNTQYISSQVEPRRKYCQSSSYTIKASLTIRGHLDTYQPTTSYSQDTME